MQYEPDSLFWHWQCQKHIKIRSVLHSCPQQKAQQSNINYHGDKQTVTNVDQLLPFKDRLWGWDSVFLKFHDSDLIHRWKYLKINLTKGYSECMLSRWHPENKSSFTLISWDTDFYFIPVLNHALMYFYFFSPQFFSFAVVFLDFTFQDAWIICNGLFEEDSKNEGKSLGWWMILLGNAFSVEVGKR